MNVMGIFPNSLSSPSRNRSQPVPTDRAEQDSFLLIVVWKNAILRRGKKVCKDRIAHKKEEKALKKWKN